jgi:type V secretory pathway adhesin AidA
VYRTATKDVNVGSITIQAGEHVFASIAKANLDVRLFSFILSVTNALTYSSAFGPMTGKPIMGFPEHE